MTKINRRDYIKQMSAAAGAFATLPAMSRLGSPESFVHAASLNPPSPQAKLLQWVPTNTPPNRNAFVTAIFWGLMGFCPKSANTVEVGIHPGGPHHRFTVTVVEISAAGSTVICTERPSGITTMTLKVIGQRQPPKVFQTTGTFDRMTGNPLDFRWLPDLDGGDFYPEPYDKHKHFGARLFVEDGIFYTRIPTTSTFKLVRAQNRRDEIREFGHVAMYMAAALEAPNATDQVSFEIRGEAPCLLTKKPGVRYEIIFKNECVHNSCPGPSTANDDDETRRNHFHFMRKVVDLPGNRIKYSLDFVGRVGPAAEIDFFDPDNKKFLATDEAPCAGAAFGQTNGFPT